MLKRLLLISNSTSHGSGYLDHCEAEMRDFLGPTKRVLFIPFALYDREAYAAKARERLKRMGYECDSHHGAPNMASAIEGAEAFFAGGGNTFRLLKALQEGGLIAPLRRRVESGAPYIGASAGSNIAGPTIKTTNDMPIVQPPTFDALALVPFNINPHYLDPDPASTHQGETREARIREFHEENDPPVVGLREGALLRIEGASLLLKGEAGARLFRRGRDPEEFAPGTSLDFLVDPSASAR